MDYEVINIAQDSPEWHELRRIKYGASLAATIMGVDPFKTVRQLYFERKNNIEIPENEHMRRGKQFEEEARQALEKETGLAFMPAVVVSKKYPLMMASLDGWTLDHKLSAEIKCPSFVKKNPAKGEYVYPSYYAQNQQQMAVLGTEKSYHWTYSVKDKFGILDEINRDQKYIDELYKKIEEFDQWIKSETPPPMIAKDYENAEKDYKLKSDDSWSEKALQWSQVYQQIAMLEKQEKELRESLISEAGGANAIGAGIKLSKILRQGNVEYKKIPELMGVDLDAYRKASIITYRIDII